MGAAVLLGGLPLWWSGGLVVHCSFGLFVFRALDWPLQQMQRQDKYRVAMQSPALGAPLYQAQGLGESTLTVSDEVVVGCNGETDAMQQLRGILETGKTYPLVAASDEVVGRFFMVSLSETRREFWPNGEPKVIQFQMQLRRDFDPEQLSFGDIENTDDDDDWWWY